MIRLKAGVRTPLRMHGFVNVRGADFQLAGNFGDFLHLSGSWLGMGPDPHFGQASAGMRYRRYSDFEYRPATGELRQLAHRPYVQSTMQNAYVGGVERHFADFGAEVIASPVLRSLVDLDFGVYKHVLPTDLHDAAWQCQIHQIRIEIQPGRTLEITPEGIHCDGYPFSGVHFWGKAHVSGAQSQLFDASGARVAATTYEDVLDTTFFLDREMKHYVTPAKADDGGGPAFRQIIAISFSMPGTAYDVVR